MESVSLPFKLPEMFAGIIEGRGLARATPSELTLEFVVKESVLNVFKTGIKELHIPQTEIEYLQHKPGWFGDRIKLRVKSMRWLEDVPGCHDCELTLRVARRNRVQAGDMVQMLGRA
jgi:hypothetical protein